MGSVVFGVDSTETPSSGNFNASMQVCSLPSPFFWEGEGGGGGDGGKGGALSE